MTINELIAQAWEQASQNEFFQGGFLLGILAWIGVQLKDIPLSIWARIDRNINYRVYIDNTNEMYSAFADWFYTKHPEKFKRIEAVLVRKHNQGIINFLLRIRQHEDINWMWYQNRLIVIKKSRSRLDNASDKANVYINQYDINGLFAKKAIRSLLDTVKSHWENKHVKQVGVRAVVTDQWAHSRNVYVQHFKKLDNVYVKGKEDLIKDIDNFLSKQELYERLGVKFKRTYCLLGPPGTGKTALVFAIADWLDMPVYYLNPSGYTRDDDFEDFISQVEPWSIVLIEDIDVFWTDRDTKGHTGVSFQSLLNVLDGLHSPNHILIFMTTNKPERFDDALMRKGRMDFKMLVDYPDKTEVEKYISHFYGRDMKLNNYSKPLPMVDVQDICIKNDDPKEAIKTIEHESTFIDR